MTRYILPCAALLFALGTAPSYGQPNHQQPILPVRPKQVMPVVLHEPGWELSDENIVDMLHSLPLTLTIRRVEWHAPAMSIDLTVPAPNTSRTEMYKNIAEILSFCFSGTSNVQQVKLRLMAEDPWLDTRHLLLAADAKRHIWDSALYRELRLTGEAPLPDYIKSKLHVIETLLWKDRFDFPHQG
ncbi:hypothetical protein RJP21_09395 [Paenibacillus sp. VCA1]|uniref:hypothetical protein n=1 Tax=Paenibacillus sp. VCA1 TaxID=3039148 RepID=UPI00287262A0|nr:hypothetical protein [Paenibacillus sp. VCA1]MDR9853815.1 hypothetical protein [Paenibacillus sp. VCA1]